MNYIHICVSCGKECQLKPGKTAKSDPVSSCCRARADSMTLNRAPQTGTEIATVGDTESQSSLQEGEGL